MNSSITMNKNSHFQQPASMRSTQTLTSIALLSAISFVLAFLEFPVPLSPSFAKMDLSDFPALIGAMALGPWAGVFVELVKNLLGILSTGTGGVGELANFLMGGSMAFVAGAVYYRGNGSAKAACLLGSLAMAAVSALTNYWILLPLFEGFMPLEALIESFTAFIPFIHTKLDVVLWNTIPFNLVKGLGISVVTLLTIPKLTPVLREENTDHQKRS